MSYYVYIMTNRPHGTLYAGVTNDVGRRVWEHKEGVGAGFTKRYGLNRLVWYEVHDDVTLAIAREKAIKTWRRAWKVRLIESANPAWDDLSERGLLD
ncbi:MAG: GIY-YIG nuclease family protein [Micropepsaceae bacterium]